MILNTRISDRVGLDMRRWSEMRLEWWRASAYLHALLSCRGVEPAHNLLSSQSIQFALIFFFSKIHLLYSTKKKKKIQFKKTINA